MITKAVIVSLFLLTASRYSQQKSNCSDAQQLDLKYFDSNSSAEANKTCLEMNGTIVTRCHSNGNYSYFKHGRKIKLCQNATFPNFKEVGNECLNSHFVCILDIKQCCGSTARNEICENSSGKVSCTSKNQTKEKDKIEANGDCLNNTQFSANSNVLCKVNKCLSTPCHPKASCNYTKGSFHCVCNSGYTGDGFKCLPTAAAIGQLVKNAKTAEEVETAVGELTLIAENDNLTNGEVTQVVDFVTNISNRARNKDIKITTGTMQAVVNITKGLTKKNVPGSNQGRVDAKKKQELVKAITAMALEVKLEANKTTYEISTGSIQMKVKEYSLETEFTQLDYSPNTNSKGVEGKITIPRAAMQKAWGPDQTDRTKRETIARRSAFIYYQDDSLFYSEITSQHGVSVTPILSADIGANVSDLSSPVKIQYGGDVAKYGKQPPPNESLLALQTTLRCMYWDFDISEWSPKGCCLNNANPPECHCNHLTNFAILVDTKNVPNDVALSVVSTVGCVLSILGLSITILTHATNRDVRKRRPAKILMQVCLNLFVVYLVFVIGVGRTGNPGACMFVAVLLHYFMLTTWCWMAVYSYDMYMSVVKVFRSSRAAYLQKVAAFAYLVPMGVVALNVGIAVGYYDKQQTNENFCENVDNPLPVSTYRADNMCWLKEYSLYFGFLLPVGVLLLYNCVVFSCVFREISCKNMEINSSALKRTNKQTLLIASSLTAIMGITWVFGFLLLLSTDPTYVLIMSYVFAVLNTLQGFGIFLLTSIKSKELRKVWWKPLRSAVGNTASWVRYSKGGDDYEVTTSLTDKQQAKKMTSSLTVETQVQET